MVGGGKLFVQSLNKQQEVGNLNVFGEVQIVCKSRSMKLQSSCGRKIMGFPLSKIVVGGLPWWSSGYDFMFPMQGAGFHPWSGN